MRDTYIWKLTMAKGRAEMFARDIAKGLYVGEHFKSMSEDKQAERIAALEAALHEIELNTEGACVELGQANWKIEQVNKVARAALAAK